MRDVDDAVAVERDVDVGQLAADGARVGHAGFAVRRAAGERLDRHISRAFDQRAGIGVRGVFHIHFGGGDADIDIERQVEDLPGGEADERQQVGKEPEAAGVLAPVADKFRDAVENSFAEFATLGGNGDVIAADGGA
mgnify:CR=1 FL=1